VLENQRDRSVELFDKLKSGLDFQLMYNDRAINTNKKLLSISSEYFEKRFAHDKSDNFFLDTSVPFESYDLLFKIMPLCLDWGDVDFDTLKGICIACDHMYVSEKDSIALALRLASFRIIERLDSNNSLQTIVYFKDITSNEHIQGIVDRASQIALKSLNDPNWTEFEVNFPKQAIALLKRKRE
jgi:hypothetical protein